MASKLIGPEFLTKETERQIEAAGLLAILPDEANLLKQLETSGFVDMRVASQSYEAARELQRIIKTEYWEERTKEPLSVPMISQSSLGLRLFLEA